MDAYPKDFIAHNLPLILLSGLGFVNEDLSQTASYPLLHEKSFRITSDLPPVTGSNAKQLRRTFLDADTSKSPWNGRHDKERLYNIGFRVKEAGRVGQHVLILFNPCTCTQKDIEANRTGSGELTQLSFV